MTVVNALLFFFFFFFLVGGLPFDDEVEGIQALTPIAPLTDGMESAPGTLVVDVLY